jgi:hypothetical protein
MLKMADWYAERILTPQLEGTKTTFEMVENRFHELVDNSLLSDDTSLRCFPIGDSRVCSISDTYLLSDVLEDKFHSNVFTSLNLMVEIDRPTNRGLFLSESVFNRVVDSGKSVSVKGELYSLDDILEIIEKGVVATDAELTKLGRERTPQNRATFLSMSGERQFQDSWILYDYGVTDPERITALKSAEIFKREEVQEYNSLPDEMFYELISLHSGKSLGDIMGKKSWLEAVGGNDPFKTIQGGHYYR